MKYFSHYIWESGSGENGNLSPVSVVLQQIKWRGWHYLFACICEGEGSEEESCYISGYVTAYLVEWFHRQFGDSLCKADVGERLKKSLAKELEMIEAGLRSNTEKRFGETYHILGILLCEQNFLCFAKGDYKGYLFNRRFNRKQRIDVQERFFPKPCVSSGEDKGNEWKYVFGHLQKGVGMLLCNKGFDTHLTKQEMVEVLCKEDLLEEQIRRRLKELWKENKFRGGENYAGAVYFRIK